MENVEIMNKWLAGEISDLEALSLLHENRTNTDRLENVILKHMVTVEKQRLRVLEASRS